MSLTFLIQIVELERKLKEQERSSESMLHQKVLLNGEDEFLLNITIEMLCFNLTCASIVP